MIGGGRLGDFGGSEVVEAGDTGGVYGGGGLGTGTVSFCMLLISSSICICCCLKCSHSRLMLRPKSSSMKISPSSWSTVPRGSSTASLGTAIVVAATMGGSLTSVDGVGGVDGGSISLDLETATDSKGLLDDWSGIF